MRKKENNYAFIDSQNLNLTKFYKVLPCRVKMNCGINWNTKEKHRRRTEPLAVPFHRNTLL